MPKYMLMFIGNDDAWEAQGKQHVEAMYAQIGQWFETHTKSGAIIGGEELQPARTATTVRSKEGKRVVSDGPFIEAKETVGGYAIVQAPDLDAAIALAKSWPPGSTVEVRPLVER